MVQHSDANRGINSATFGAESFFNLLVLEKGHGGPSSMKSAQRSAIITVGAFVFPLTSSGMIEMSAMRRRGTPWTRSFGSTTAIESTPILQVQDG